MTRHTRRLLPAALTALLALLLLAPAAGAEVPSLLAQAPEDGLSGGEAGRMHSPSGIAVDPVLPGDAYVVDEENQRVDEFTPWGAFVRAWGWGVADGKAEVETCTTHCQAGISGSGAGQFSQPEAIAVDGEGHVYVMEQRNHRVQEFSGEGAFIKAFGGAGTEPGEFNGAEYSYSNKLATSPVTGEVFVGEGERIQVFHSGGAFKEEIAMPEHDVLQAVAAGPSGDIYVAFVKETAVYKIEPGHAPVKFAEEEPLPSFEAAQPRDLTVDSTGDVYAAMRAANATGGPENEPQKVLEFDSSGKCLDCGTVGEGGMPGFDRTSYGNLEGVAGGGACGTSDAYVAHFQPAGSTPESFLRVWGAPPDPGLCPPPSHPPVISTQYATSVGSVSAQLQGSVNPEFWADTSYHVEYGTEPCSLGGCKTTASFGLGAGVVRKAVSVPPVVLEELSPGTTYHYRFVAESGGGGPVYGVAPEGGEASAAEGLEGTFTTYATSSPLACPGNEVFRTGASALLPDCRAFEMVSPVEKEGAGLRVMYTTNNMPGVLVQSSLSGEKLVYGSARAFGDAHSAPSTSQYMAVRNRSVGWESRAISPPRERALAGALNRYSEFKLFTPDLCSTWIESLAEPPLAKGAPAGQLDLYRQDLPECGASGAYAPLNTSTAPGGGVQLLLQGVSEDGETAVFTATNVLAPGGTGGGVSQLYGSQGGVEKFLCVLPGGTAFKESCSAGWGSSSFHENEDQVTGALSADGRLVYWTAPLTGSGDGPIYLRENPFASGRECVGEAAPCTLAVSKTAEEEAGTAAEGSRFWAAAKDGSRMIFTTGKLEAGKADLYEYRLSGQESVLLAEGVRGVLGVSSDASHVYLTSVDVLSGANGEGVSPVAGQPNLYLYDATLPEGERFRFVGALAARELEDGTKPLGQTYARVGAGGKALAFDSTASLTGYDNTDQATGAPDAEVFLYREDAGGGKGSLVCASCDSSGARPDGRAVENDGLVLPASAAWIPVPENLLYSSRVLSETGNRLFFNSFDSLTPRDNNGMQDVYEWEAAGEGSCTESSGSFSAQDGGCVSLISSGQSTAASEFWDATPSGSNVFFTTLSSLVPQHPGLVDMYDARVDGGLPVPSESSGCEGEACQAPVSAPGPVSFGSLSFSGPGNLTPGKPKAGGKGKGKGKKTGKAKARRRKLHKALKRCRKRFRHNRHRRQRCKRRARRRFGVHARKSSRPHRKHHGGHGKHRHG